MKKLLLLLLWIPLSGYTQVEDKTPRVYVGFMFMPELNNLFFIQKNEQNEVKRRFGFSSGMNIEFVVTKRFSARTGFGYGYKRYEYHRNGLIFNSDIDPQLGVISESRAVSYILFREIQFPLTMQYEVLDDRFFVALGTDLVYAFSGTSEQVIYFGNGVVEHTPYIENQFNTGIRISAGYEFSFSENLNLTLEPVFRYYVKPYLVNDATLCNLGLNATLNVGF